MRDLLRQCGGKPRYIPEKDELLRYADWDYYERTPQMDALTAFLMNEGHQSRRDAEEIAGEIQYACVVEAGMEQIFDILSDYGAELDDSAVEAFVKVMMSVKNNTRLWANKGHTPNELAALYYRGAPAAPGEKMTGNSQKRVTENRSVTLIASYFRMPSLAIRAR